MRSIEEDQIVTDTCATKITNSVDEEHGNASPVKKSVNTSKEKVNTTANNDNTKLLICIDSNREFLDSKMFWKPGGTLWKECSTTEDVSMIFRNESFNKLEVVVINCGVDDIDAYPGPVVADKLLDTVNEIRMKYPSVKIVVSEITPRNDLRDSEVIRCNEKLTQSLRGIPNIFLVEQGNLRDADWSMFYDVKHIKQGAIATFAANLKKGIRTAYGMELPLNMVRKRNSQRRHSNNGGSVRVYRRQVLSQS